MSDETRFLTITVTPIEGAASLNLLLKSLEGMRRVLVRVDQAVYGPRSQHSWSVHRLASSTPTITIEADASAFDIPLVVVEGIKAVNSGAVEPPPHFSEPTLESLTKLRTLFSSKNGLESVGLSVGLPNKSRKSETIVDKDIPAKAGRILAADYSNLGSIEGTLEIINAHALSVTVWERLSGAPVRCDLPAGPHWIELAKSLLTRNVLVAGDVRYFTNGVPRSVGEVVAIEDAPKTIGPMKAHFGALSDPDVQRLGSVEFLRRIRAYGRP